MRLVVLLLTAGVHLALAASVVPWESAADHVGRYVTVEGDVVTARVERDTCVLEFSTAQPAAFRAILLIPMITALPAHPERVYQGKRVRVTGQVQRFRGTVEMVLQSPDQIEIVNFGAAPPEGPAASRAAQNYDDEEEDAPLPTMTTTLPAPAARSIVMPPPAPPSAPAPPAAAPAPAAAAPPVIMRHDPCPDAQRQWRDAATAVQRAMQDLDRCVAGTTYRCRKEAAAMAPLLSTLQWAEQTVRTACP